LVTPAHSRRTAHSLADLQLANRFRLIGLGVRSIGCDGRLLFLFLFVGRRIIRSRSVCSGLQRDVGLHRILGFRGKRRFRDRPVSRRGHRAGDIVVAAAERGCRQDAAQRQRDDRRPVDAAAKLTDLHIDFRYSVSERRSRRLKYSSSPLRNSSGSVDTSWPVAWETLRCVRTSCSLTPEPSSAIAESTVVPLPPPPGSEPPPPPPLG